MRVLFNKRFKKQVSKYPFFKIQIDERIILFLEDPFHPRLNNHPLAGKWMGYRSINITDDYRAVYRNVEEAVAYFVDMDTHSNLYS